MRATIVHRLVRTHGAKFIRFLVSGGLGACVDFGSLQFFVAVMGLTPKYALLGSSTLSLVFVFVANRFFTFRSHGGPAGKQLVRFFVVYLTAATLNYVLSLTFITLGFHYIIAKALAIGLLMFFNFFFLNSYVFKTDSALVDEVLAV